MNQLEEPFIDNIALKVKELGYTFDNDHRAFVPVYGTQPVSLDYLSQQIRDSYITRHLSVPSLRWIKSKLVYLVRQRLPNFQAAIDNNHEHVRPPRIFI